MGKVSRASLLNYRLCTAILSGYKSVYLEGNTWLEDRGTHYAVRLYKTDILTFHPDGTVRAYAMGHRTATTKQRLNTYGPRNVYQERKVWHVGAVPFFDGIELDAPGLRGQLLDDWFDGDLLAGMALRDLAEEKE